MKSRQNAYTIDQTLATPSGAILKLTCTDREEMRMRGPRTSSFPRPIWLARSDGVLGD